jgi:predicted  nucleic acid-binding Zn-ribbon protein
MAKQKAKKQNGLMGKIRGLHDCIESDQNQLGKLYKKAAADAEKSTVTIKKRVDKAKKHVAKAKKSKKDAPKDYQAVLSQFDSLKKQLSSAQEEQALVVARHEKFIVLQKTLLTQMRRLRLLNQLMVNNIPWLIS